MTTKEVLELTSTFLGKEDLLSCSYFTNAAEEISSSEQKELDILTKCLNLIVGEIATDYLPIYNTKTVKFTNGEYSLTLLDANIYQIVKVCDEYNTAVRFNIQNNKILANIVDAKIKYTKFAEKCLQNGNVETFNGIMPARVLAYGTAMEYCFVNSLFDDAKIWESRYKNSLLVLSQKKHNVIMPKRRWL